MITNKQLNVIIIAPIIILLVGVSLFIAFKDNLYVKDYKKEIKENIKRIKKKPNLKGQTIFYPGEQKFLRTKTNSEKFIKIPKNIKKDLDILLAN